MVNGETKGNSQTISASVKTDNGPEIYDKTLTLPDFSSGVKTALSDGNSSEVWGQMIEELVTFYSRKYPNRLKCSDDYQLVGRMMYSAYPSIGRFGTHKWVCDINVFSDTLMKCMDIDMSVNICIGQMYRKLHCMWIFVDKNLIYCLLKSALTNTLSNRMRNLRFKRKAKSSDTPNEKLKRKVSRLEFSVDSAKTETSVKSKVYCKINC